MNAVLEPTATRFHALARSSPWRWTTLRFILTEHPVRGSFDAGVRAWLARPDRLRVEHLDGRLIMVDHATPQTAVQFAADGGRTVHLRPGTTVRPELDEDGLVRALPSEPLIDCDDPMFQSYYWVAMLNPVELSSDHEDRPAGTHIDELREVIHHDRPAWEAVLCATEHYSPRCRCCALVFSAISDVDGAAQRQGWTYADRHRVRLDVETGVCVYAEEIGGSRAGRFHDVAIEAVDEPMPPELFPKVRGT